jgi:hypothetical protein
MADQAGMPAAVSHQGKEEAEANTSGSAPIGTETETEKQSRDSTGADTAASTSTPMDAASETGASVAAGNEAAQKSESQGASDTTVVSTVLSEFYLILALPQYGYTTAAMASCDTEVKPIPKTSLNEFNDSVSFNQRRYDLLGGDVDTSVFLW